MKKIFLSYKSSDPKDRKSAKEIKNVLERISPDAVKVFVSDESVHVGEKWRAMISEELCASDYLILIYTDPEAHWDWCLFEVGLFLGAAPEGEDKGKGRIFCIHPVSVGDPPSPLADFQHIELPGDLERLKTFLMEIFVGDDPIRKLWLSSNVDLIPSLAYAISAEVARMSASTLTLCRSVRFWGVTMPELDPRGDSGSTSLAIPDSYSIDTDEALLAEIFGKSGKPKNGASWTWKDLKPNGQHPWISELATSMAQYIRDGVRPQPIRSSFKCTNGGDYRPILAKVARRPDDYSFEVLFLEEMPSERTETLPGQTEMPPRQIRSNACNVFVSYCREESGFREELIKHLKPLSDTGQIRLWHDGLIEPGEKWEERIIEEINQADVVVFLVTAAFMASEFCQSKELKIGLARYGCATIILFPVIVGECGWKNSILGAIQMLPRKGKPPKNKAQRQNLWNEVHEELAKIANQSKHLELRKARLRNELVELPVGD